MFGTNSPFFFMKQNLYVEVLEPVRQQRVLNKNGEKNSITRLLCAIRALYEMRSTVVI